MRKRIKQALISLSDKTNLKSILKILKKYNINIISSGGTSKEIKKLGFSCKEITKFTKSSEILDGRVKTLHPKIYAGILAKRNSRKHIRELKNNNYENIDLIIVNFYPFEKTLEKTNKHDLVIENIDIGGPTLVRAAAKNYKDVTVITNTNQYNNLINEMEINRGSTNIDFRKKLSEDAFALTAYYDSVIANYFSSKSKNSFPEKRVFYGNLIEKLRYGENPHQESAIYSTNKALNIEQLGGKQLSYNNYNDIFSAISVLKSFPKNLGTVIVKHTNPCGVSIEKNQLNSYKSALACDPVSAYGGVVSCNYKVRKKLAFALSKIFLEVIIY